MSLFNICNDDFNINNRISLLGHKDRCFDIRFSPCSKKLVSSSEDGTARVWSLNLDHSNDNSSKKVKDYKSSIIKHSTTCEVLRATFLPRNDNGYHYITCGADGKAIIWKENKEKDTSNEEYLQITTFEHNEAQIYACELLGQSSSSSSPSHLITAADNNMHVWDLETSKSSLDLSFTPYNESKEFAYGGARNPDNVAYIFDVKMAPSNSSIAAAALSDGSIRLSDLRMKIEEIPIYFNTDTTNNITPLSVSWSPSADTLLVGLSNHMCITVDTRKNLHFKQLFSSHQKSIFGATFVDNNRFISWSSDCSIRLWDVNDTSNQTDGMITIPKKIAEITNFPILTAAVDNNQITNKIRVACAGGQSNNFLGSPVYFFKSFV